MRTYRIIQEQWNPQRFIIQVKFLFFWWLTLEKDEFSLYNDIYFYTIEDAERYIAKITAEKEKIKPQVVKTIVA